MKRPVVLLLCATSIALAAEVLTRPEDCATAWNKVVQSLPHPATKKHHSAETIQKWKDWNKAHPDWKPTRHDTITKIDFACNVEYIPVDTTEELTPVPPPDFTASIQPDMMELVPDNTVQTPYGTYPSELIYGADTGGGGYPIIYAGFGAVPSPPGPPGNTVAPPPVAPPPVIIPPPVVVPPPVVTPPAIPEPATLLLFGTGLLGIVAIRKRGNS